MAFVTLLAVIAAGVYLTMTMLFKIGTIQVQTADGTVVQEVGGYSSSQILQALGVQTEENIFSFDPAAKEAELEKQFPLLESIRVVRDYPNTVVVQVTEAVPTYAMQTKSGWADPLGSVQDPGLRVCPAGRTQDPIRRRAGVGDTRRPADLCSAGKTRRHRMHPVRQQLRQRCRRTTVWMR